jgi:RND family efflux transporter MFP subunit
MAATDSSSISPLGRKNRKTKRLFPKIILIVIIAAIAYFGWMKLHPAVNPYADLITAQATRGDMTETITATGAITAQTGAEVKIGSQITGTIKRLFADVGTQVKAGQIIAELNLPDIYAQLAQAKANLEDAQTKLAQQLSGLHMEKTQTYTAILQAQAGLRSSKANLANIQAAYRQQIIQTPSDIHKAETDLGVAKASLSTAESNLAKTQASINLEVANAQEQANQAESTAVNTAINLKRQLELYQQGYVAASAVDDARTQNQVAQSQAVAAKHSLQLTKEQVVTDLQSAKDQVAQAKETLKSAQASLEAANAETWQSKAKLAAVHSAEAQVNQAEAQLTTALANSAQDVLKNQDIEQARETVLAAQAQVDFNQAQVNKTVIRTPISGTVLQLAAQQGETLAAGLSAPTLIIVANLNKLEVDAYVDETDIGKVHIGQDVQTTVDAFPHRVFHGKVFKIASGSTIQQGVITYDVSISLDSVKGLKPDMSANTTILVRQRHNVLMVPSEAIQQGVKNSTVNILQQKDGKSSIESVKVKTGVSDGVNTEILSGVQEGQTVVLAGMQSQNSQFGPQSPFGPRKTNAAKKPAGGAPAGGPPH